MSTRTPLGLADDDHFQFGVVAAHHVIPLSEETVTVKLSAREGEGEWYVVPALL